MQTTMSEENATKTTDKTDVTEVDYEQILAHARKLYRNQRGYRGQQVSIYDSHDYWIMVATREFFNNSIKTTLNNHQYK
jgi:hypothetical protein